MKLLASCISAALAASGTDYSVQGDNWPGTCASGQRQSPINIDSQYDKFMKEFTMNNFIRTNYIEDGSWKIALSGGIKLSPEGTDIRVDGGYLPAEYKLLQFHLHWGDSDSGGSEHTMEGKRYFSEVHLVHYNIKYDADIQAGDVTGAFSDGEGLAVLGYFIDVNEDVNAENTYLDDVLQKAFEKGHDASVDFNIDAMVGSHYDDFYRYEGSLTTPECNEAVQWTVFNKPLMINQKTKALMTQTTGTKEVNNNYRVTLPMNGRTVTYYHSDMTASAETTAASLFFATCAALALY